MSHFRQMFTRTQYDMAYYVCMQADSFSAEVLQSIATSAYRRVLRNERDEQAREYLTRECEDLVSDAVVMILHELDLAGARNLSRSLIQKRAMRAIIARKTEEMQRIRCESLEGDTRTIDTGRQTRDQRSSEGDRAGVKRRRRKGDAVVAPLPALYATPPSAQSDASARATLARAIASLDDAQRDVIHAIHIRGASQADAARELGLTRAQVRTHERAGLARLGVGSMAGGG